MQIFNVIKGGKYKGISKWKTLEHNGPLFPAMYQKHNIPIIYNNKNIILSERAEEYATLYARYISTDYINNKIFNKNFWDCFKPVLDENLKKSKLEDFDFRLIHEYLLNLKKEKKNNDDDEKYKFCIIDGIKQKVGNYKIEPPSIFIGRGSHPKLGKIKKRIYPHDVIINIDKKSKIPDIPIEYKKVSNKWQDVIHDNKVEWLASWKEEITDKRKYIFTSLESTFKSNSDKEKFNLANNLGKYISKIRKQYYNDFTSNDIKYRQLSTALYLIDTLALRVGNNKDKDNQADTVGVSTLRREHIKFIDDNNYVIRLKFLGKDYIEFKKDITVDKIIYNNFKDFTNSNDNDLLFDQINSIQLNNYLNDFMKGLTSKVWRTYNATHYFMKEMEKVKNNDIDNLTESEKSNYILYKFKQANAGVAILCNHKKSTNNKKNTKLIKINDQLVKLKKDKNKNKSKIKILEEKKKLESKSSDISLSTSKNNYIDPRVIFHFIEKFNVSAEKVLG